MSYKIIDTDTLAESIENAFQEGRSFQSNRDESALFLRIEKLIEEYDPESMHEDDIVFPEDPRKDGWNHGLHELKMVIHNEFEEDSNCMGFIERERRLAILTPDSEDSPNVEIFQAQQMLADIRELLATPESYGGESKEKLELIVNILCRG